MEFLWQFWQMQGPMWVTLIAIAVAITFYMRENASYEIVSAAIVAFFSYSSGLFQSKMFKAIELAQRSCYLVFPTPPYLLFWPY